MKIEESEKSQWTFFFLWMVIPYFKKLGMLCICVQCNSKLITILNTYIIVIELCFVLVGWNNWNSNSDFMSIRAEVYELLWYDVVNYDYHMILMPKFRFPFAGIAGMCSKTTVAPLDRIKILLQAHSVHYKHLGVFSGLAHIVKKESFIALYKGNGAQMVRIFPYAATQFTAFEIYKRVFILI